MPEALGNIGWYKSKQEKTICRLLHLLFPESMKILVVVVLYTSTSTIAASYFVYSCQKRPLQVACSVRPPGFVMQCERPLWYFGLYCVPNNNSCHGTSRKSWSISAPFRESKTFSSCFSNQKYTVYSRCSGLSFWLFLRNPGRQI